MDETGLIANTGILKLQINFLLLKIFGLTLQCSEAAARAHRTSSLEFIALHNPSRGSRLFF